MGLFALRISLCSSGTVLSEPFKATTPLFMVLNLRRKYQVTIKLFNKCPEVIAKS